jgi:hypothetical protein
MDYVTLIGGVLEDVLGVAASATSGQVSYFISMLDRFVAAGANLAPNLIPVIQNIISSLSGNSNVTAAQITQLQAQSTALDAALDAAAKDDQLT